MKRQGSAVISSGENSSSAIRLATKASPQTIATMTAMRMSAGFIVVVRLCSLALFLLSSFVRRGLRGRVGLAQEVGAVHGGVIVGRDEREADVGQHALHHPAEGGIFVAHMRHDALARKIVVLDLEVGPLLDI